MQVKKVGKNLLEAQSDSKKEGSCESTRCKASWQGASKKVEKNLLNSQRGSCDSMCTFITIHRLSSPLDIRFCEEEGASSKQEVGAGRYFLQLWLLPTTYSVEAQAISSSSPR